MRDRISPQKGILFIYEYNAQRKLNCLLYKYETKYLWRLGTYSSWLGFLYTFPPAEPTNKKKTKYLAEQYIMVIRLYVSRIVESVVHANIHAQYKYLQNIGIFFVPPTSAPKPEKNSFPIFSATTIFPLLVVVASRYFLFASFLLEVSFENVFCDLFKFNSNVNYSRFLLNYFEHSLNF